MIYDVPPLTGMDPWLQFLVRVWVTAAAVMAWM